MGDDIVEREQNANWACSCGAVARRVEMEVHVRVQDGEHVIGRVQ